MAGLLYFMAIAADTKTCQELSSNYNFRLVICWRVMETLRILLGEEKVEVYSVDECF